MTGRDSPLLVKGIFPSQEKDDDVQWWSEKGERGGGDHGRVKKFYALQKRNLSRAKEKRDMRRGEKKRRRGCRREGG